MSDAEKSAGEDDRRRFLHRLSLTLGAAIGAVIALPWIGVVLTPTLRRDPLPWHAVGRVAEFEVGETRAVTYLDPAPLPWAGFVARNSAWLRRDSEDDFMVFATYCTHVGCPVRWEEGARLFMCPCHGGAFYMDGTVAAGPPPRPLDQHPVRVRAGLVEIQAIPVRTD